MTLKDINALVEEINETPPYDETAPFYKRLGLAKGEIASITSTHDLKIKDGFGRYKYADLDDVKPIVLAILTKYGIQFMLTAGNELRQARSGKLRDITSILLNNLNVLSKTEFKENEFSDNKLNMFLELKEIFEDNAGVPNNATETNNSFSALKELLTELTYDEPGYRDPNVWIYSSQVIKGAPWYTIFGIVTYTLFDFYSDKTWKINLPVMGRGDGDPNQALQSGLTYSEKSFYKSVLGVVLRENVEDPDFVTADNLRKESEAKNNLSLSKPSSVKSIKKVTKPGPAPTDPPLPPKPKIEVPTPPVIKEPTTPPSLTLKKEAPKPELPKPTISKPPLEKPVKEEPKLKAPTAPKAEPTAPTGQVTWASLPPEGRRASSRARGVGVKLGNNQPLSESDEFFTQFLTEGQVNYAAIGSFIQNEQNKALLIEELEKNV